MTDQSNKAIITPAQLRGARGMLDWSMLDLAKAAGVSVSSVKRMESEKPGALSDGIRATVDRALEAAGVEFLPDEGRGEGVRRRKA